MRRRGFLWALATGLASPLGAHALQTERLRRVGVLMHLSESDSRAYMTAFVRELACLGWTEGKNIRIDYRFPTGDPSLFKKYAAELVALSPDALLASTPPAVIALRDQTRDLPIVFVLGGDPLRLGYVQSLARPGGNITGLSSYNEPFMGKWLQLLKEVAPNVTRIAAIFNPDTNLQPQFTNQAEAASSLGVTVTLAPVRDTAGIEKVISALAREPGGGLVILPDAFSVTHRDLIIAAALQHGLPLISVPTFARAGGLMSYYLDTFHLYGRAASYIDRILRGAKPADLPVEQPTKFSLIINLKTANALGLTVPVSILAVADEVIE